MSEGPNGAGDDRTLVKAAQAGDAKAFRALVERYQRRVVQLALAMTKDADEAMDIAQETFVRVHRYLPSFKGDSSFFTWTYRIAMNLCLDAQRRKGRLERVDVEQGDEAEIEAAMDPPSAALAGPQRQALNAELRERIEEALASLSDNHRAILLLREVEGLSYEDLAKVLGIRKGTVMSRLFHARLKMQNKLREYLGEEAPKREERSVAAERAAVWGREMWWAHRRAFAAAGGLAVAACMAVAVLFLPWRGDDAALIADNSPQIEEVDFGTRNGAVLQLPRQTTVIWMSDDRAVSQ